MPWESNIHAGTRAIASGFYDQARGRFLEAIEAGKSFAQGDPLWGDAHRGLARACLALERYSEAETAAAIALETDQSFWGAEHPTAAESQYLLGEALRLQDKFESAKTYFDASLAYWSAQDGDQNESALLSLSSLLLLYLQSKRETGFSQIHARAFAAYQSSHPTGMWMRFTRLQETLDKLIQKEQIQLATEILNREVSEMAATLGRSHKEMKPFLEYQSQLLQKSKKHLAAWRVSSQIGKAQQEGLFFSDSRTYGLPPEQTIGIMSNLIATRGSFLPANAPKALRRVWWHINKSDVLGHKLQAVLELHENETQQSSGFGSETPRGRLELDIRCVSQGSSTQCTFEWHLQSSSDLASTRDIRRFTLEEFDQTFLIIPNATKLRHTVENDGNEEQQERARNWPTPQMYNEAIQNARQCFLDTELQNADPELNSIGLPRPFSGAFATVYRLSSTQSHWAVKCFTEPVTDQEARYERITEALASLNLAFFTKFQFQKEGIRLANNSKYPILKMSWVDGQALNVAIGCNLENREMLSKISAAFLHVAHTLQSHGIAHGDLQHGNILVGKNGLILVDYDDMYVPKLAGFGSNAIGHRNYQHPARSAHHFGPYLDNFSEWVIYVSLFIVGRHPELWNLLDCGDESLLFKQADFTHPASSKTFDTLAKHQDKDVREAAATLRQWISLAPENVPSISNYFSSRKENLANH
ncbi:MAG: hypothetical protein K2X81_02820 [Candidatus Obscuribacterales bacterium]|nr:hypothetical protein [Candidatus Obscuribacterales bacterium]